MECTKTDVAETHSYIVQIVSGWKVSVYVDKEACEDDDPTNEYDSGSAVGECEAIGDTVNYYKVTKT